MNPSSHWNDTLLGKVDRFPIAEPLTGERKGPQSLAEKKLCLAWSNFNNYLASSMPWQPPFLDSDDVLYD